MNNNFIKNPNLPDSNIKACIISPKLPKEMSDKLKGQNIELLFVKESKNLQAPVSHHADMLTHHTGGRHIFLEKSQKELYQALKDRGFLPEFINEEVSKNYPHDVLLNISVINKLVFCNTKFISEDVLSHYKSRNFDIVHINQGYAKCSSLILNQSALITDDSSIYNACKNKDIDCLFISKGDIVLDGFSYGFIGGAGALISKNKLIFFGDYKTHKDANKIESFAKKHGLSLISLSRGRLQDFGGLIPLLQK